MDTNAIFFDKPAPEQADKLLRRREIRTIQRNLSKGSSGPPLVAKNPSQELYIEAIQTSTQVFGIGSAGTGKTYIAARLAGKLLRTGVIERIVLCRSTVADPRHKIGFLPGKGDAKMAPWVRPIVDALKAELGHAKVDAFMKDGSIEIIPFEHMRGLTLDNAFVILDEAQNCTLSDLQLFLTRKGEGSSYVITGDPDMQVDLHKAEESGLNTVLRMIEEYDLSPAVVIFDEDDVVRSEDAKEWVRAFRRYKENPLQ